MEDDKTIIEDKPPVIDNTEALKELEELRKQVADQKTAAELAKLNEADRAKALLENERKSLAEEREKLTQDKNIVFAKNLLLSDKYKLGDGYVAFLNITPKCTDTDITKRADALKALIDAEVKKAVDGKQDRFSPGNGSKDDDIIKQAAALATNKAPAKSLWGN